VADANGSPLGGERRTEDVSGPLAEGRLNGAEPRVAGSAPGEGGNNGRTTQPRRGASPRPVGDQARVGPDLEAVKKRALQANLSQAIGDAKSRKLWPSILGVIEMETAVHGESVDMGGITIFPKGDSWVATLRSPAMNVRWVAESSSLSECFDALEALVGDSEYTPIPLKKDQRKKIRNKFEKG